MPSSTLIKRLHALPLSLLLAALLLQYPIHTLSYSWRFKDPPKQCGTMTIDITGSDGQPPYHALVIPDGPNPLSGNEVRKIMDVPFDANATSVSFRLEYPANGRLVVVISDASGFGTGGTSVSTSVADSDDDSCFDSSSVDVPLFVFDIEPRDRLSQCAETRFYVPIPDSVQGNAKYRGVIPGGQAFDIPQGPITDVSRFGRGFTWKCNARTGTQLLVIAGDDRGIHTGGSINLVITNPSNGDSSCLDGTSPSSTPGTPAGGRYPTGISPTATDADGGDSGRLRAGANNTATIVGGIIGGLVALAAAFLLIFFYRRRIKQTSRQLKKPTYPIAGDGSNNWPSHNNLYNPEPFIMLDDPTRIHPVVFIKPDDARPRAPYGPQAEDEMQNDLPPAYTTIVTPAAATHGPSAPKLATR